MRRLPKYTCFVISLFMAVSGLCQQYLFDHFSSREGVSNDVINNIFQDEQGFIYISTNDGLTLYDGSSFRTAALPVPDGQQLIRKCKQLKNGKIWVNYAGNKELTWMERKTTGSFVFKTRAIINNVVENLTPYPLICSDQGLFAWQGDSLRKLPTNLSGNDKLIYDVIGIDEKTLLITRKGLPAALIDRTTFNKITESDMNISLSDYVNDLDGNIWIASEDHGLLILDGAKLKESKIAFKTLPIELASLNKEDIFCMSKDENGNILIGTNHFGLLAWNPKSGLTVFDVNNGLSSNTVKCMLVDKDNNWWIGTNYGIDRLNNKSFQLYNKKFQMGPGVMYYTEKDLMGRTWFFAGNKMHYLQGQQVGNLEYPTAIEKIILHASADSKGIWAAAPSYLFYVRCNQGKPAVTKLIKTEDTYRRMLNLGKDKLLLGGKKTLALLHNNKLTVITDSITDIRTILKDRFNRIWIGTFEKGIYRLTYDSVENKFRPLQRIFYETKNIARINSLFEDANGNIWVGTRFDGVIIFNADSMRARKKTSISSADGLCNNYVTSITASSSHFLWVAGHTGFDRINIRNEPYSIENTSRFYSFNNPVTRLLPDGSGLWGTSDIGAFYVSLYPQRKVSSPVYLKEIILPDTSYSLLTTDTTISLRPSQNSFAISFTSPFYTNEKQTSYTYRLRKNMGSADWIEIRGSNSINFNSLNPGKYLLEIKAVMFNGQQASKIASLNINLATPFYKTAWFIVLLSLVALLLAYSLYLYRIGQLKRMFSIRNTISRNLHDEIGATLSSINIYSDVARKKNKDDDTGQLLERIYKSSGLAMASMNDIVWLVNPANDSLENVVVRMREFCIPLLEARDISIHFEADDLTLSEKLSMHKRQHIYYIFKEAVNNILKYAGATQVTILFTRERRQLILSISDNGKGFDISQQRSGNGIRNMMQRAKDIRGILEIETSLGNGCTIRLQADIT